MNFFKKIFGGDSKEAKELKKEYSLLEETNNSLTARINETITLFKDHNLNQEELRKAIDAKSILDEVNSAKELGIKFISSKNLTESKSILQYLKNGLSDDTLISLQEKSDVNFSNLNNFERSVERALTSTQKILKENNLKLKNKSSIGSISRDHTVFDLDREALLDEIKKD